MEGLLINRQPERATPSHRSIQRNASKKVNPKRKDCDSGRPQNRRKAFLTDFKSSSSVGLLPSHKPSLLPLPPNIISSKYSSSIQFSRSVVKATNPVADGNHARLLGLSKGRIEGEEKNRSKMTMITTSGGPLGSDPDDLPREVFGIFRAMTGGIFSLSPPPSSLPLPKFSLKQKHNCRTEVAAGIGMDLGGATDSLRRLLRIS